MTKESVSTASDASTSRRSSIALPEIVFSPYGWLRFGAGEGASFEAMMPGAYLKFAAENTSMLGVFVDFSINRGCPAHSMPVIEYSVDNKPFKTLQLPVAEKEQLLVLAEGLSLNQAHCLDFHFRAADLCQKRWDSSAGHLRLSGIALASQARLLPIPARPKKALGFGDSITEGVGTESHFTSWQKLEANRAGSSWFPLVCSALDCEYGQLGTGGQGIVSSTEAMPSLLETWDHYDGSHSRLAEGLLLPEPDYVFCCMGTNDFRDNNTKKPYDITNAYSRWLSAVRKSCPSSTVFCIIPPFGWHCEEIQAAVSSRNKEGDSKVYLIDTAPLKSGFDPENKPSRLAYDGCHPSLYGNALLAALIAVEAQKIIDRQVK